MQTIFRHEVFENASTMTPLAMATQAGSHGTGFVQPFDQKKCLASLASDSKMFLCGINIMWLDFTYTPTPNIPMFWTTVKSIQKHFFASPDSGGFSEVHVEIPITAAQVDSRNLGDFGTWRHSSPTEILMAWVLAVALAVTAGADVETMKKWVLKMLSVPALFRVVENEAKIPWRAEQLREDLSAKESLSRTTVRGIGAVVGACVCGWVGRQALQRCECQRVEKDMQADSK